MKKICFLITTRGNYGKTKTIIDNLRGKADLQYIIGGNCPENGFYGEVEKVTVYEPIENSAGVIAIQSEIILKKFKPDVLVIVGDRFECLPVAMIAYYMGIQIAHIEGGELSGNIDEGIRHAITKLASAHFCCGEDAKNRLIRLGENPRDIFNVGATSFDILKEYGVYKKTYPYIVQIIHPSEGIDIDVINSATNSFGTEVVWIDSNIDRDSIPINKSKARLSFSTEKFAELLKNASCIVGNSSSGIREASFLGVPSISIGKRQLNRKKPYNIMTVPCERRQIEFAIKTQIEHGPYEPDFTYGNGNAGSKIAETLLDNEFETQKVFYEGSWDNSCKKG